MLCLPNPFLHPKPFESPNRLSLTRSIGVPLPSVLPAIPASMFVGLLGGHPGLWLPDYPYQIYADVGVVRDTTEAKTRAVGLGLEGCGEGVVARTGECAQPHPRCIRISINV